MGGEWHKLSEAYIAPPLRARKLRAKVRTARMKTNQARGMR